MKITDIDIKDVLGISSLYIVPTSPVTLFAGDNYAGKSSIREAIKAAFLGVSERVLKKKDFSQLVHDGSDTGSAVITFEGGHATFVAPKGDQELKHGYTMDKWESMALALPYCLDIDHFARASGDERRGLLFSITGASAKTADIVAALKKRGLDDKIVETVTPLLRSGFPAAAKFAEERAREAKGAWKAITGETYGHVKAETWRTDEPDPVNATAMEEFATRVETLRAKISTEQTRLGGAEQKLKAWLQHTANQDADRKAFAKVASLEKKLAQEQDDLTDWDDKVKVLKGQAGTGPRVGLVHDLAACLSDAFEVTSFESSLALRIDAVLEVYEAQHGPIGSEGDPEAASKLQKAIEARDLLQRCAGNTRRDIDAAKAAGARLAAKVEKGSEEEVAGIDTILAGYKNELDQATVDLSKRRSRQLAIDAAKSDTAKAKAHHEAVKQWQVAIDALSPTGIPAEILGKALNPITESMRFTAEAFSWPDVAIDADMMITAGGRAYALLSESEKWRTNTIIALALASLSGLRLVALDRVDVLNLAGRAELVDGLDALADDGFFDTALLFGTFKKLPNFEQFPNVTGYWVEAGAIAKQEKTLKEAA